MPVARSVCRRIFCKSACFGSVSASMPRSICVYEETPVSGVLISCATPAARRPMEESFSRCCNCSSSRTRPVTSSRTTSTPPCTAASARFKGASAMLRMSVRPVRVAVCSL